MTKRIKVADLPKFDAARYLDSETTIAAYLSDILEANDAALLAAALGNIARARGMTEIAKSAGITREALYKALRPDSAPRFDTVNRVCAALGVRLVAQPVNLGAEHVQFSERDKLRVLDVVENPPAPNPRLLAASRKLPRRASIARGTRSRSLIGTIATPPIATKRH